MDEIRLLRGQREKEGLSAPNYCEVSMPANASYFHVPAVVDQLAKSQNAI